MAQDTMVAEYRGVRLRREVADRREERYRCEGKDCYLFAVSDDCVIDSTMRGTISRFTVRPASLPCCRYKAVWQVQVLCRHLSAQYCCRLSCPVTRAGCESDICLKVTVPCVNAFDMLILPVRLATCAAPWLYGASLTDESSACRITAACRPCTSRSWSWKARCAHCQGRANVTSHRCE